MRGRQPRRGFLYPPTAPRVLLLSRYSASAHPSTTSGAAFRARAHEISRYPPSRPTEAAPGGGCTFLLAVNSQA